MSEILRQFREKHPIYKDVDDARLASGVYNKYYADKLSEDDFYKKIGLPTAPLQQPTEQPTIAPIETQAIDQAIDRSSPPPLPDLKEIKLNKYRENVLKNPYINKLEEGANLKQQLLNAERAYAENPTPELKNAIFQAYQDANSAVNKEEWRQVGMNIASAAGSFGTLGQAKPIATAIGTLAEGGTDDFARRYGEKTKEEAGLANIYREENPLKSMGQFAIGGLVGGFGVGQKLGTLGQLGLGGGMGALEAIGEGETTIADVITGKQSLPEYAREQTINAGLGFGLGLFGTGAGLAGGKVIKEVGQPILERIKGIPKFSQAEKATGSLFTPQQARETLGEMGEIAKETGGFAPIAMASDDLPIQQASQYMAQHPTTSRIYGGMSKEIDRIIPEMREARLDELSPYKEPTKAFSDLSEVVTQEGKKLRQQVGKEYKEAQTGLLAGKTRATIEDFAVQAKEAPKSPALDTTRPKGEYAPTKFKDKHIVVTPMGTETEVRFKVVEADDLITSNQPEYLQELQPRNRGTTASDLQVKTIAQKLDPEQLGYSKSATGGSPIVGSDNMVESGNARIMAIKEAYKNKYGTADAYKKYLKAEGHNVEGFKNPVLVRERTQPANFEERIRFAKEANQSTVSGINEAQQSIIDSQNLTPADLDLLNTDNLNKITNKDFIKNFLSKIPQNDLQVVLDNNGNLTQAGLRRINNAIMAKAYPDSELLGGLIDSTDTQIKDIGNALYDSAIDLGKLKTDIEAGYVIPQFDITKDVMNTAKKIQSLRNQGRPIGDEFLQAGLTQEFEIPVKEKAIARLFFNDDNYTKPAGKNQISERLNKYSQEARKVLADQEDIFGTPTTSADVLNKVLSDNGSNIKVSPADMELKVSDDVYRVQKQQRILTTEEIETKKTQQQETQRRATAQKAFDELLAFDSFKGGKNRLVREAIDRTKSQADNDLSEFADSNFYVLDKAYKQLATDQRTKPDNRLVGLHQDASSIGEAKNKIAGYLEKVYPGYKKMKEQFAIGINEDLSPYQKNHIMNAFYNSDTKAIRGDIKLSKILLNADQKSARDMKNILTKAGKTDNLKSAIRAALEAEINYSTKNNVKFSDIINTPNRKAVIKTYLGDEEYKGLAKTMRIMDKARKYGGSQTYPLAATGEMLNEELLTPTQAAVTKAANLVDILGKTWQGQLSTLKSLQAKPEVLKGFANILLNTEEGTKTLNKISQYSEPKKQIKEMFDLLANSITRGAGTAGGYQSTRVEQ